MRVNVAVPERVAAHEPDVMLDHSRLPSVAWNTAIPVDPGDHQVSVTVRGLRRWETSVTASEEGATYRVEVPAEDPTSSTSRAGRTTAGSRSPPTSCASLLGVRPHARRTAAGRRDLRAAPDRLHARPHRDLPCGYGRGVRVSQAGPRVDGLRRPCRFGRRRVLRELHGRDSAHHLLQGLEVGRHRLR